MTSMVVLAIATGLALVVVACGVTVVFVSERRRLRSLDRRWVSIRLDAYSCRLSAGPSNASRLATGRTQWFPHRARLKCHSGDPRRSCCRPGP